MDCDAFEATCNCKEIYWEETENQGLHKARKILATFLEILNMKIGDIEYRDSVMVIGISESKIHISKQFIIVEEN